MSLRNWKPTTDVFEHRKLQSLDLNSIICYFIGDDKNISYKQKLEKEIYKKIEQVRKKDSIISSNTSTIPFKVLSADMSDK